MEVKAIAKNIRVSPYKARLVVKEIKKMKPNDAVKILGFTQKAASIPLKKVIMSAIANAKNNNNIEENSLMFKEIQVGHGLVFKRYRPISRGRAHDIRKRTSHIRVVLKGEQAKKKVKEEVKKTIETKASDKSVSLKGKGEENGTKS